MRDVIAVTLVAVSIVAVALATLPGAVLSSPESDDNSYPEVNPCASGVSEVSGTIKVCTLIKIGEAVQVMTHPLRAMVWIQISATGPTAHVSDTLNGVAWVQDTEGIGLTQRDDWHVAIQSWNLPPDVELLPPARYTEVNVNEARTFVFNCLGERCDRPAPTPTPTITSRPPNATPVPSVTPTDVVSGTASATSDVTPEASATPTGPLSPTMTATGTTVPMTSTATSTVTATGTATLAPTAPVTTTATPTAPVTTTATPTATATASVLGSVVLEVIEPPTSCVGIRLRGTFSATSSAGSVDEMRTVIYHSRLSCAYAIVALENAPWEPFEPTRAYSGNGGAHVYASFLAVQYRDAQGNLSERMCDSVEGICLGTPTLPPPTPTPWAKAYLPQLIR